MPQQVIVTVTEQGAVTVEAKGCPGPACHDLTREIEKAIGSAAGDVRTPEFHQQAKQAAGQGARAHG